MKVKLSTKGVFSKSLMRLATCGLLISGIGQQALWARSGKLESAVMEVNQQQSSTIIGKIIGEDGAGIPGVNVLIKGTTTGTVTDLNGEYSLQVPAGSILVFSYLGYTTQEIKVGNSSTVNITMKEDTKIFDEVVVIGYGTQRKGEVTSAVASVKAENFIQGKIDDAAELVKGKIAGLTIINASGDPNVESTIKLRGNATLFGNVSPLVLVDGMEGSLTSVAPENIASIDVLKDGSAAAIYGTRGANGVILITTKAGKRDGTSRITYSTYWSVSDWYKTADFMDTHDVIYARTSFPYEGYDTDWLEAVTRKAGSKQNHSISFEGGSNSSTYSANITYSDEEGIMRKSDSRDLKAQLDFNQYALNDILKFNVNMLYGTHKNTNNNNNYVYRQAMIHNPSSPVYNEDGSYYEEFNRFQYYNPVAIQNELIGDTRTKFTRLTGNVMVEPIKGWQTNLMVSLRQADKTTENYYTSDYYTQAVPEINGSASKGSENELSKNLEITTKYFKTINKHNFTALGGYSYLYNVNDGFNAGNSNFPNESYLYNSIEQGTYLTDSKQHASMSSYKNDNTLIGFFGRATYGYDNRYNAVVSIRHEGSSKFGENNQWGNFPAASVGWTMSNEQFMKSITWLDNLKLRLGYGVTGVIPDDSYKSLVLFDYDEYGKHLSKDGVWTPSLKVYQNPNPDLKWETTREWNLGFDWAVLNSRLNGAIDLYSKKTDDCVFNYNVPVPPNFSEDIIANAAQISNNGIEIMINAIPIKTSDFEWNTTLTMSHNENKVLSVSNDLYVSDNFQELGNAGDPISVPTHCLEKGHQLGDFWGLKSTGVSKNGFVWVQVKDDNGNWVNKEFDTKYNEEKNRQRIGNGIPQVVAGWSNTLKYKGFDLNLMFTGMFGFQILNLQRSFYENNSIAYNRLKSAADWHGAVDENGAAVIDASTGNQKQVQLSSTMQQGVWSDHVEDGDFVKLSNATLGYTFPISASLKKYIQYARLYVSGQNLFCITNYSGLDPEVTNSYGGDFRLPGIDSRDKYPTIRSYTIGLTVNF